MTEDHKPTEQLAIEFADVARCFCAEIDNRRQASSIEDFLMTVYPLIAELCFRASVLPDLEPEGYGRALRADSSQWQQQFNSLTEMLGRYDTYWEVFDPRKKADPIVGTLSDDLSGIYEDIMPGLKTMDSADGNISVDMIVDWRLLFLSHWGHHAIDALRTIHAYADELIDEGWD